ncbi:alpha-L-fucosidase 1 [Apodospora peruviana]|uniref:alpha-L-fucosidase n=1 Tax=Apodospora peruviana TaxID=516989 RepID=A0AAE0LYP9_9PEZI|nr:alpha-L-fucosidase 1 [Apodospora peruviana]
MKKTASPLSSRLGGKSCTTIRYGRQLLFLFAAATTLFSQQTSGTPQTTSGAPPPAPHLRTPTQRQLDWHRMEYYAFVHFGPNTFTNEEWGKSQSLPDVFSPTNLDTDQWAKTFADAGMAGMILTAKHHDGMALWNTTTTIYKIGSGTWAQKRALQGLDTDVVRLAAQSARKYGIKFGVYLSPWDMHRDPAVPKPGLRGTVYDEAQIFGDSSSGGDYNDLYTRQLTELVTMNLSPNGTGFEEKVDLFEIWLDGASGSDTVQTFDWARFRDIIRANQPGAVMWGHQGVDARWVGNEDGVTTATNWHTINRTQDQAHYGGEQLQTGMRDGLYWAPAEADARMRSGWFYHANERSKTGDALMSMYLQSVGRSVNLLLDVPPDTTGRIVQTDVDALMRFKELRDAFLRRNVLKSDMKVAASSVRGGDDTLYGPANALDGRADTYWAMNDGETKGSVEIDLGGVFAVDAVIVQEHIALGQRIGGYAFDVMAANSTSYKPAVTGTSLGYKRIDRLAAAIQATRIRVRVTQANAPPLIQSIQVLGSRVG